MTVDDVLFALRFLNWKYRWTGLNVWRSYCPACRSHSLDIEEGFNGVRLKCRWRCGEPLILGAFSELLEPLTVAEALGLGEEILDTLYRLQDAELALGCGIGAVS